MRDAGAVVTGMVVTGGIGPSRQCVSTTSSVFC